MSKTDYAGIDYRGSGSTVNMDVETGVHYGVISQHSIMSEALDSVEYDYAGPNCPKCGTDNLKKSKQTEFYCPHCRYHFDSDEAYGDEAIGFHLDDGEYQLQDCLDTDIFVLKSPYYTFAQYCSPCVPGAGNLDNPCDTGPKTYALGHEWFEKGNAPYTVYRVSDDEEVKPE